MSGRPTPPPDVLAFQAWVSRQLDRLWAGVMPGLYIALMVGQFAAFMLDRHAIGWACAVGILAVVAIQAVNAVAARGLLRFGALMGAYIAGLVLTPDDASLRFYEAVSQVIPILILALAVQGEVLKVVNIWSTEFGYLALVLLLIVSGEVAALDALASGPDPGSEAAGGAVGAGLMAIVLAALFGPWNVGHGDTDGRPAGPPASDEAPVGGD